MSVVKWFFKNTSSRQTAREMFFKNVSALYDEIDTTHKSFFDIFLNFFSHLGEIFYVPRAP